MLPFTNFEYNNATGHPYDDFDENSTEEQEFFVRGYNFTFHDKRFYIEDDMYSSIIWCSNGTATVPVLDIQAYTHFVRTGAAAYTKLQEIDRQLDIINTFGVEKLCEAVDFINNNTIYRDVIEINARNYD